MADSGVEYWGLCDGCESRQPRPVRDVDGCTVCAYHALQTWHDSGDDPMHVEVDW